MVVVWCERDRGSSVGIAIPYVLDGSEFWPGWEKEASVRHSRQDRPWGSPNCVPWVPGVKLPGRGVDHNLAPVLSTSSAIDLHSSFAIHGMITGWSLPHTCVVCNVAWRRWTWFEGVEHDLKALNMIWRIEHVVCQNLCIPWPMQFVKSKRSHFETSFAVHLYICCFSIVLVSSNFWFRMFL
jgi:hypothetical protein